MCESSPTIAVLVPCYNEEATVGQVVEDFREALPDATIYVYDNNSTDATSDVANAAGAVVVPEYRQGKGNAVRSMFRDVDADVYVLVDGDSTYPAEEVHKLITPVIERRADMVVGDRISSTYDEENKRLFHSFGNRLVRWLVNRLFASRLRDIMSGYRAFSRRFVKNWPVMSDAFEIETEMTIFALDRKFNLLEVPITYRDRPAGSASKLRTISDGFRILRTILTIFKDHRPLVFFGSCAVFTAVIGLAIGLLPVYEYMVYAYVYRVPSAILAAALELLAMLLLSCGLILDTIVRQHRQLYELSLLRYAENRRTTDRENDAEKTPASGATNLRR